MNTATPTAAPLTWSQLMKWLEYQNSPPPHRHRFNEPRWLELPAGTSLEVVQAAVDALVERHEALRTTFDVDERGDPEQSVQPPHSLPVEPLEVDADPDLPALLAGPLAHLLGRPMTLESEWPIRAAAVFQQGHPTHVLLVIHQLAIDAWSFRVLTREFEALVGDLAAGRQPVLAPVTHQPRNEAAYERSPAGQRAAEAAQRYWEQQLGSMPHRTFPIPPSADGLEQSKVMLSSAALTAAARALARRQEVSAPTVVLAAFAMLIARYTGLDSCALMTIAANRTARRSARTVGTFIQPTLAVVDLGGDPTFGEVVGRTAAASMKAYRHAHYDYAAMRALQHRSALRRGVSFDWQLVVNSRLTDAEGPATDEADDAGTAAGALLDRTQLSVVPVPAGTPCGPGLTLFIARKALPGADAPVIELYANPAVVASRDAEHLLRSLEALLVAVADGAAPRVSELGELAGMDPLPRPPGWRLIDNCLVNLDDVRRALLDHPGVDAGVVAVEEREPGRESLVAYAASPDASATPASLRQALLARLAGQPSLMVPHWYVLCRQPPEDPSDVAAWRKQSAVDAGTGASPPDQSPQTPEQQALCQAVVDVHGLASVSTGDSYILAGGTVERVPAVQRHLLRNGYVGLALDHFCGPSTLGQLAARLVPLSQVGDLARLGLRPEAAP